MAIPWYHIMVLEYLVRTRVEYHWCYAIAYYDSTQYACTTHGTRVRCIAQRCFEGVGRYWLVLPDTTLCCSEISRPLSRRVVACCDGGAISPSLADVGQHASWLQNKTFVFVG
jgi:hypothetical protein